jgi:hypothetical protein
VIIDRPTAGAGDRPAPAVVSTDREIISAAAATDRHELGAGLGLTLSSQHRLPVSECTTPIFARKVKVGVSYPSGRERC